MKAFSKQRHNYAACQRCIMRLLAESPLPWSREMLRSWYDGSISTKHVSALLDDLIVAGRIWRCTRDSYTAISRYEPQKVIVTDEMLKRYGFNL